MIREIEAKLTRRVERGEERLSEIDRTTLTREDLKDALQATTQSMIAMENRIMAALGARLGNGNGLAHTNGHAD